MLDNIVAPDEVATAALVKDLRTLCGLPKEQLAKITEVFAGLSAGLAEVGAATLASALRPLRIEPDVLQSVMGAANYLWDRWARGRLTKDQILTDLQSLDIGDDQLRNVTPLIDVMHGKLDRIRRIQAERGALSIGTPLITGISYALDARIIFKDRKFHEDAGDAQLYYDVDFLLPIMLLEIEAKLNDERHTTSYILDEKGLDELSNILSRARKRLKIVKDHVAQMTKRREVQA